MRYFFIGVLALFSFNSISQKSIQKDHLVFDMGLSYTGALNFGMHKPLYPKVGYDANMYYEHEFNNSKLLRIGIGSSLNGFSLDTRFRNVLHAYYANLPILYGKKSKKGNKCHIGINLSYCFASTYSETITTLTPKRFDTQLMFSMDKKFNKYCGLSFSAKLGLLNLSVFEDTYATNYSGMIKFYLNFMAQRNVSYTHD